LKKRKVDNLYAGKWLKPVNGIRANNPSAKEKKGPARKKKLRRKVLNWKWEPEMSGRVKERLNKSKKRKEKKKKKKKKRS